MYIQLFTTFLVRKFFNNPQVSMFTVLLHTHEHNYQMAVWFFTVDMQHIM